MCRRFTLVRDEHDGVNQPGTVAEGIVFAAGKVALCWTQRPHSIQTFDSIADVLVVQKQNHVTRLVWVDAREEKVPAPPPAGMPRLRDAMDELAALLGPDHVLVSAQSSRSMRMDFARETATGDFPAYAAKSKD